MWEIVLYSINNMVSIGSLSPQKKKRKSSFRMCFCLILNMCGNASGWSTRHNWFSYMDYTDHHIPSGKCLHNELERSTMLFTWVNQRTFYGHFPCRFLYIQQPAPKICAVLGWWRFSSLGKSSVSMDHGFQFAMSNNRVDSQCVCHLILDHIHPLSSILLIAMLSRSPHNLLTISWPYHQRTLLDWWVAHVCWFGFIIPSNVDVIPMSRCCASLIFSMSLLFNLPFSTYVCR